MFDHSVSRGHSDGSLRTGACYHTPINTANTACSVNDTPNLGRHVASLEAVPLLSKTSYRWTLPPVV